MGWFSFLKKSKPQKRLAIIDVGDADFKQQVVQRSYKMPVMVDYWAAWCGPCRQLGPVLERLAEEPESDFILAKLNTEQNQRTAAQYQIHSIPHVKVFRNGQIVDEFTGALPEPLVRRFVSKVTNSPPPPPQIKGSSDPKKRLQEAEQHLRKGRGFEAFVLLSDFPPSHETTRAEELLPLARFLFDMDDGDGLTGLDALDKRYLAASQSLKRRKPAAALDNLFAALDVGESIDVSYTTQVIESLLALLGESDKVGHEYRQRLTETNP